MYRWNFDKEGQKRSEVVSVDLNLMFRYMINSSQMLINAETIYSKSSKSELAIGGTRVNILRYRMTRKKPTEFAGNSIHNGDYDFI